MPNPSRSNLRPFRHLALLHLQHLRKQHPAWRVEDLLDVLELEPARALIELAQTAGFKRRTEPTAEEIATVLILSLRGVCAAASIAKETGIPVERVKKVLALQARVSPTELTS